MSLVPGTRFGAYEIVARLGAGGMGEAWRARDERLEREVALKVLPAQTLADETARARLLREARLASRLNHPNVCTIYEVGTTDGQPFIAMELVAGQTLAERLVGARMAVEDVLRLGCQMADALSHAHEHGVVHRDFKSANVVVTPEGRAKVLDFGLAKPLVGDALEAATTLKQESLTGPGEIAGTLAYMAPEQLRARPADARSDVWALGVVLHEMVSGERPFQGGSAFELSSAVLNEAPRPLPAGVPPALAAVVERCLQKEPGRRYQRAAEVRSTMEALQAGTEPAAWPGWRSAFLAHRQKLVPAGLVAVLAILATLAVLVGLDAGGLRGRLLGRGGGGQAPAVRMAVLPFANLTGDPEQEYLSDGITQELITQLGRLHPAGLSVIARTSVMRYKKGDTPVDQIGRELKVDYVLEGSAQRESNRIRITAELIHVRDQTQLWASTFERELSGILTLQAEVAQRVARALALELLPAEQARLASAGTVNPEAYEAYLKGSYHWKKLTPPDLDTAQRYFELALAKDPSYAPAHAGLAWVWGCRQQMGITPPREAGPKAKTAALQAIELDDRSAEAHEALAVVRTWTDWDWAGAALEWQRALELDPNAANAHAYYAHFLAIVGRVDEAVSHSERALELDPFNALFEALYSVVLYFDRRYDDAVAAARRALAIEPGNGVALYGLLVALAEERVGVEALAAGKEYVKLYGFTGFDTALDRGFSEDGFPGAMKRGTEFLTAHAAVSGVLPTDFVFFCIHAGERARALDWLERGYEERDPNMPYISMPLYDPLRSEPRFQALLRRMNLKQ